MNVKVVYGSIGSTFSSQAREALFKIGANWNSNYYKEASHFLPMEYTDSTLKLAIMAIGTKVEVMALAVSRERGIKQNIGVLKSENTFTNLPKNMSIK